MKRRRMRKTTQIELEMQEVVFSAPGSNPLTAWCPGCARESLMDSPEKAAQLAGVRVRAVYRWVESGDVHFTEAQGGALLVCLASLFRIAPQVRHDGTHRYDFNKTDP